MDKKCSTCRWGKCINFTKDGEVIGEMEYGCYLSANEDKPQPIERQENGCILWNVKTN